MGLWTRAKQEKDSSPLQTFTAGPCCHISSQTDCFLKCFLAGRQSNMSGDAETERAE